MLGLKPPVYQPRGGVLGVGSNTPECRSHADDLRCEIDLRMGIAVGDAALATLLIVQHETHSEAWAPRPVGLGAVSAISDEVARGKIVHHWVLLLKSWGRLATPPGSTTSTRTIPAEMIKKRHSPSPTSASEVKVIRKAARIGP